MPHSLAQILLLAAAVAAAALVRLPTAAATATAGGGTQPFDSASCAEFCTLVMIEHDAKIACHTACSDLLAANHSRSACPGVCAGELDLQGEALNGCIVGCSYLSVCLSCNNTFCGWDSTETLVCSDGFASTPLSLGDDSSGGVLSGSNMMLVIAGVVGLTVFLAGLAVYVRHSNKMRRLDQGGRKGSDVEGGSGRRDSTAHLLDSPSSGRLSLGTVEEGSSALPKANYNPLRRDPGPYAASALPGTRYTEVVVNGGGSSTGGSRPASSVGSTPPNSRRTEYANIDPMRTAAIGKALTSQTTTRGSSAPSSRSASPAPPPSSSKMSVAVTVLRSRNPSPAPPRGNRSPSPPPMAVRPRPVAVAASAPAPDRMSLNTARQREVDDLLDQLEAAVNTRAEGKTDTDTLDSAA